MLRLLGPEEYGAWLVLLQVAFVVGLATGWLAAPVVRETAGAFVTADSAGLRRLLITTRRAYGATGTVTAVAILAGSTLFRDWSVLTSSWDRVAAVVLLALSPALSMQVGLTCSVLVGSRRMHVANLLLAVQGVAGLGLGVLLAYWHPLAIAPAAGYALAVLAALLIGWRALPRAREGAVASDFDWTLMSRLLKRGGGFAMYACAVALTYSDVFVVSYYLGAREVAAFAVAAKVVDYAGQFLRRVGDSTVGMFAEFDAQADELGALSTFFALRAAVMAATLAAAWIIVAIGHCALTWWVGVHNVPSPTVVALLALGLVMRGWSHVHLLPAYGANRIGPQATTDAVEALFKLGFAPWTVARFGVAGLLAGGVAAWAGLTSWLAPILSRRILRAESNKLAFAAPRLIGLATLSLGCAALVATVTGRPVIGTGVSWPALSAAAATVLAFVPLGLESNERRVLALAGSKLLGVVWFR